MLQLALLLVLVIAYLVLAVSRAHGQDSVGTVAAGTQRAQPGPDNSACVDCHDDQVDHIGPAHSAVACATCHKNHEEAPHAEGLPKPQCISCHATITAVYSGSIHAVAAGRGEKAPNCESCHGAAHDIVRPLSFTFRKSIPDICGRCHTDVVSQFKASIHGSALAQDVADAPTCTSCHGEHGIRAKSDTASKVNNTHIRETCGQCHGNVMLSGRLGLPADRLTTFDQSFHGLALKGGSQTVANCASCHGVHNILPSSDRKSMVNVANLPKTCGRCHPGAGTRFAIGTVHQAQGMAEPAGVEWVRWFYLIVIPLTLGFMFLHNFGDWVRKLVRIRRGGVGIRKVAAHKGEVRMYPFERVQHVLLAVSFIVLSWSGFALQWPNQWWSLPLTIFDGLDARRNVHRVAAAAFVVAAFVHLFALIFNKKLRGHWKTMLPKWSDLTDALHGFAYNVGLSKRQPELPAHSYVEKMEYWAVVWGAMLMSLTGLLLWSNTLALQNLPKSWLDVATAIHWYEAVLAAAAIVIWHFYSVILDPEVYPLDTAFLTGISARMQIGDEGLEVEPDVAGASPAIETRSGALPAGGSLPSTGEGTIA
jgi:cytochrome b subunit of formate dehydrogenase